MYYNPLEEKIITKERLAAIIGESAVIKKDSTIEECRKKLKPKKKETTHIFIGSNKGGVGKSMASLQIAWTLYAKGYKVLLADLDAQANITCTLLEDEREVEAKKSLYNVLSNECDFKDIIFPICEGLELMGANKDLSEIDYFLRTKEEKKDQLNFLDRDKSKPDESNEIYKQTYKAFKELGENYDFVIYDTNPETNKFNRLSMQVCDIAVIPIQAKESSLKGRMTTMLEIKDSYRTIERDSSTLKNRIKLLFNNSNEIPVTKKEKVIDMVYKELRGELLTNYIDYSYELGEASDVGYPSFAHDGVSIETIRQISSVVDEIIDIEKSLTEPKQSKRRKHLFVKEL